MSVTTVIHKLRFSVFATFLILANFSSAQDSNVAFEENFEAGIERWELLDPKTWQLSKKNDGTTFEITARETQYKPPVRSPGHVALIKGLEFTSFEISFRVRSTKDTGGHRDCCIFFAYQDDQHFYYAHLGAKPDPASGQIMIVNKAPRRPLTENTNETPWDDKWHDVRLVRRMPAGTIEVFFDSADKPLLSTVDKTFEAGRVGIGSFDDMNEFDNLVVRRLVP